MIRNHGHQGGDAMRIECPHCRVAIDVVDEPPDSDITCPSCLRGIDRALASTLIVSPEEAAELDRNNYEMQPAEAALPTEPENAALVPPAPPKRRLGRYELESLLGRGAFGEVWKAFDTTLHRRVALKLLRSQAEVTPGDEEKARDARLRFEREARTLVHFQHPGIVRVYEFGEIDGRLYLASELIEGLNLQTLLKRMRADEQSLTPKQAAQICGQVAEALHAAHQAGIVHRDLKPANILMDTSGLPHVADFGLAKRDAPAEYSLTQDNTMLGTPEYMSPEQWRDSRAAGPASDIYSVGVILYELLTGRVPFPCTTDKWILLRDVVLKEDPIAPRRLNLAVPVSLETICLKCLEKDPSRRFPTAAALAQELHRFLHGEPIHSRPITQWERARKWCQRNPIIARLSAAVVLSLLIGTIVSGYFAMLEYRAANNERTARLGVERQLRVATAHRLAGESRMVREQLPARSLLLAAAAVEATRQFDQPVEAAAENALRDAFSNVGGRVVAIHDTPITCSAVTPDGRWLITGGYDGTTRLWDLSAGDPAATTHVLRGHEKVVTCLSLSSTGRWLTTGSEDATARVWDLSESDPNATVRVLRGHELAIACLSLSADGRWLVTGSRGYSDSKNNTLRVWDLSAADPAATARVLRGHELSVECLSMSSDARWLATGSDDKTVRIWDLSASDPDAVARVLHGHEGGISCLSLSTDGRWLVTGEGNPGKTIRVWDLLKPDPAATARVLRGHESSITCLSVSPDGRWLVTGSGDKTARVWDLLESDPVSTTHVLRGHESDVIFLSFSPDGRWLVTGSRDRTARAWDLSKPNPDAVVRVLRGHDWPITCVSLSADGRWVVTGSMDTTARVWDLSESESTDARVVHGQDTDISCLSLGADSRWFVTGTRHGTARLLDLSASDPAATAHVLSGHKSPINSLSLSFDNRWLVTGSGGVSHSRDNNDNSARVWDLSAADPAANARDLTGHVAPINCLSLSPDGRWLVTGSDDKTARVWDLSAADPAASGRVLRGHQASISCVSLSADGRWLVTGSGEVLNSKDSSVRVWDLSAADPASTVHMLRGHEDGIRFLLLSADGRWLVTGSDDKSARLWDLSATDPTSTVRVLGGKQHHVNCAAFSRDGRWLVAGTGRTDLEAMLERVSFSATDGGGVAQVWDLFATDPAATERILRGHEGAVTCVSLSVNGRWLATGSSEVSWLSAPGDKTVRLWDLSAADPSATARVLQGVDDEIRYLSIAPNGEWLVAVNQASAGHFSEEFKTTARVLLWDMRPERLVNAARLVAGRSLTTKEFQLHGVPPEVGQTITRMVDHKQLPAHFRPTSDYFRSDPLWHERQITEATIRIDWFAVTFHVTRRLLLQPDNDSMWQQLQQAAQRTVTTGRPLPSITVKLFQDRNTPLPKAE